LSFAEASPPQRGANRGAGGARSRRPSSAVRAAPVPAAGKVQVTKPAASARYRSRSASRTLRTGFSM
jgi:hypothetical protein